MELEAGELQTRALVQERSDSISSVGEFSSEWVDVSQGLWIKLQELRSSSTDIAKGTSDVTDYEALARHNPKINSKCRLVIKDESYLVTAVIHDPLRTYTKLFLSKVA